MDEQCLRTRMSLGADAVERRQMAHEYEVTSPIAARLLDRDHVGRRLHDAQQPAIPAGGCANRTEIAVSEHPAAPAATESVSRVAQCAPKFTTAGQVPLQQMERHPLRGFWSHPG